MCRCILRTVSWLDLDARALDAVYAITGHWDMGIYSAFLALVSRALAVFIQAQRLRAGGGVFGIVVFFVRVVVQVIVARALTDVVLRHKQLHDSSWGKKGLELEYGAAATGYFLRRD